MCWSVWKSLKFWASCLPLTLPSVTWHAYLNGFLEDFLDVSMKEETWVSIVVISRVSFFFIVFPYGFEHSLLLSGPAIESKCLHWHFSSHFLHSNNILIKPFFIAQQLLWPLLGTYSNTLWLLFISTFFFLISSLNFSFLSWRLFVSHFLKLQVIPFPHWRLNFVPNG